MTAGSRSERKSVERRAITLTGGTRHLKIPVPEKLAVIGIDNEELTRYLSRVALSSVAGDNAGLRWQRLQPVGEPVLSVLPVFRRGLHALIIPVPEKLAVIGIDNEELTRYLSRVALSSVAQGSLFVINADNRQLFRHRNFQMLTGLQQMARP
jgi:hypothetical protein